MWNGNGNIRNISIYYVRPSQEILTITRNINMTLQQWYISRQFWWVYLDIILYRSSDSDRTIYYFHPSLASIYYDLHNIPSLQGPVLQACYYANITRQLQDMRAGNRIPDNCACNVTRPLSCQMRCHHIKYNSVHPRSWSCWWAPLPPRCQDALHSSSSISWPSGQTSGLTQILTSPVMTYACHVKHIT